MPPKQTKAQKAYEQEQSRKREEFAREYRNMVMYFKSEGHHDELFDRLTLDEYVSSRMHDWEANYAIDPVGRFDDPNITRLEFQKQFIVYLLRDYPRAFEDLKRLSKQFLTVLGNEPRTYERLISYETRETIEGWASSFHQQLAWPLINNSVFLQFPEFDDALFRKDFRYASLRPCFLAAHFIFEGSDNRINRRGRQAIENGLITFSQCEDVISILNKNRPKYTDLVVNHHRCEVESTSSLRLQWNELEKLAKTLNPTAPCSPAQLIKFLIDFTDWIAAHNLGKWWIVRYALYILELLATGEVKSIKEVEVPRLNHPLATGPAFRFEYRAWDTYAETRKEFEQVISREFDKYVSHYFKETSVSLDLKERKRITKPVDFRRASWVVLHNIAGMSVDELLDRIAGDDPEKPGRFLNNESLEQAIADMCRSYDLPMKRSSDLSF